MKISRCVGIDLGTTNSVIAMVGSDNKTILCRTDSAGRKTFPSVIVYDKRTNGIKSGQPAFNRRGSVPEPIVSIKSHMGDPNYRAATGPVTLSPVEVSAEILREMKTQMQEYLNNTPGCENYVVDRAVITVPAYFAATARESTTKAAELAGLKVEYTLQEPTASALYYCHQNDIDNGIYMVYDLGGGTFDVSIVRIHEGDAFVLGIAGNNYLGGDNFDDALARHLLKQLQQDDDSAYDLELEIHRDPEDMRRFTRLKLQAEIIKKALSLKEEHFEEVSGIFNDKSGNPVNMAAEVTRAEFEGMIRPLLDTTLDECLKALGEAEKNHAVTLDMIDAVLLVGGSTHIPLVSRVIEGAFTNPALPVHTKLPKPLKDEPDMAVGYGAAIAAAGCATVMLGDEALALGAQAGGSLAKDASNGRLAFSPEFQPGTGYDGLCNVEGRLGTIPAGSPLPGAVYARVTRAAGGFQKEYPLAADGSFLFEGLRSEQDPEPYACQFIQEGNVLVETAFDAAIRNARRVSVTLSRDYFIETLNENTGRAELAPLMKRGAELPVSRDYEFATNSTNQYFAVLRFFEEGDFLKKITITFDHPVPPGTPVKLSLSCSLQSRFSARAEVAGKVVTTEFEQSPAPELPTFEELDELSGGVTARIAALPTQGERIKKNVQAERLEEEIQQAIEEKDTYKARDKMNALRKLAEGRRRLVPERRAFDALVDECLRKLANSQKDGEEKRKTSAEIDEAARGGYEAYDAEDREGVPEAERAAFDAGNQARLSKAVSELSAIQKAISDQTPPPPPPKVPLWMICQQGSKECLAMIDAVEARDDLPQEFREMYLKDANQHRRELKGIINSVNPFTSDEECEPLFKKLRTIYGKWSQVSNMDGRVTL
jgi:molecular chaperone DnaK